VALDLIPDCDIGHAILVQKYSPHGRNEAKQPTIAHEPQPLQEGFSLT
jgi:hypothetical protein